MERVVMINHVNNNYLIKFCKMMICVILLATLTASAMAGTIEEDEKDCAEEMGNLASCMPYVSGSAKKPSPECCEDTTKVRSAKPKCLCVLIKESADPSMGLPINTTLALQMPTLCNIDAKVSDCPAILKLPPNSPDAKIFQADSAGTTNTSSSTPTHSSLPSSGSTTSASPSSSSSSCTRTQSNIVLMISTAFVFAVTS